MPKCDFNNVAKQIAAYFRHGVKVGPRPRNRGPWNLKTRDPVPATKFKSGTRDPLQNSKVGTQYTL